MFPPSFVERQGTAMATALDRYGAALRSEAIQVDFLLYDGTPTDGTLWPIQEVVDNLLSAGRRELDDNTPGAFQVEAFIQYTDAINACFLILDEAKIVARLIPLLTFGDNSGS